LEFIEAYEIRKYDVKRVRRSISAALDFKISDNHILYATAMYNWRDDLENRFKNEMSDLEPILDGANQIVGYEGTVVRETKGGIDNNRNHSRRLEDQRMQNYALRGDHLLGANLDLDWSVNYSTASEDRPNERYIAFEQEGVGFSFNGDPRVPLFTP